MNLREIDTSKDPILEQAVQNEIRAQTCPKISFREIRDERQKAFALNTLIWEYQELKFDLILLFYLAKSKTELRKQLQKLGLWTTRE